MTRSIIGMVALLATAIHVCGCRGSEDDYAPAVVPRTFAFEGKIEPKYVGNWSSTDGSSTIDIMKGGVLKIETVSRSVAGQSVGHITGKWLVDANNLSFQYVVGAQKPTVLKYSASISGNTLTLQLSGGKMKTTYRRK